MPITKYSESKDRDFNIFLQADYAFGHARRPFYNKRMDENKQQQLQGWLFRGGYMAGWSLYDKGESYNEDMLFAEIHSRVPLKNHILFSQRFRFDTRWLGEEKDFSYRLRIRFMIERELELKRITLIPYINVEPFWDSRYERVVKTRVIGGATFVRGPVVAFETNLTYQYDDTYSTPNLFALNIILHLFFERKANF
jgi:hypothetical protein